MNGERSPQEWQELTARIEQLEKTNQALMGRVERSMDVQEDAFQLFRAATALEHKVAERTAELKTAMAELEKSNEQLTTAKEAADAANAAKSEFLANMSHEIRTPMNGILGMTELLAGMQLSIRQRDSVDAIRRSALALLGIINDILDFSKIEAGKLCLEEIPFDVRSVLHDTVQLLAEGASRKGLVLQAEIPKDVPTVVKGDPGRLRQILLNLLGNAVKFTERGTISFRLKCLQTSEERVSLRFEIQDTGAGLEAEKVVSVFEPFTQADGSTTRRFGGTGLGLPIAKQLVMMMGGDMGVESEVGQGSCFWFEVEFGRASRKAVVEADPLDEAPLAEGGQINAHVLLAEDHEINQTVAVGMLEFLGCSVVGVVNGSEALERLKSDTFDLVLMDCQMPEMDGYEATRLIRRREVSQGQSRLPIVALTANVMQGDRERCLAAGMDDFLPKPFTQFELARILRQWVSSAVGSVVEPGKVQSQGCAESATSLLDEDRLAKLRAIQRPDRPDIVVRVLRAFLEDAPGLMEAIREARDRGDVTALNRGAHSLKSVSGNIGATRLSAICREMELTAGSGNLISAVEHIPEAERQLDAVCNEIRRQYLSEAA